MAYQFTASNQSLSFPAPTFGTSDMTIALKFQTSSAVQYAQLIGNEVPRIVAGGLIVDGFSLLINHDSATDGQIRLYVGIDTGPSDLVVSATALDWSDGAPHNVTLTRASNSFTLWVDGVSRGTGTSTRDLDSTSNLVVGRNNAIPPRNLVGNVSEIAIWTNTALNANEVSALSIGFSADQIRPQSLQFYAPLVNNLQDVRGGQAITNNNGATVATHPRVYT